VHIKIQLLSKRREKPLLWAYCFIAVLSQDHNFIFVSSHLKFAAFSEVGATASFSFTPCFTKSFFHLPHVKKESIFSARTCRKSC